MRVVIVEDALLARELVTQELAVIALIKHGVRVLHPGGDDLTETATRRAS